VQTSVENTRPEARSGQPVTVTGVQIEEKTDQRVRDNRIIRSDKTASLGVSWKEAMQEWLKS
jgi:hypothetical protein